MKSNQLSVFELERYSNFNNTDELIEQLGVKGFMPEEMFSWKFFPKFFRRNLKARKESTLRKLKWLYRSVAPMVGLLFIVLYGILIYSTCADKDDFVAAFAFGGAALIGLGMCLWGWRDGWKQVYYRLTKKLSDTPEANKRRALFEHCKELIENQREKFFDPDKGEFIKLDLDLQKRVDKAENLYNRFHNLTEHFDEALEGYSTLEQGKQRAEQNWVVLTEEYESFQLRKSKVLNGLRRVESKIDEIDLVVSTSDALTKLAEQERSTADLLIEAQAVYYKFANSLANDMAQISAVTTSAQSYLEFWGMESIEESEQKLLAASIAGRELDQSLDSWLLEPLST